MRSHLDDIYKEVYNSERAPLSIYENSQIEKVQDLELELQDLQAREAEHEKEIKKLGTILREMLAEKHQQSELGDKVMMDFNLVTRKELNYTRNFCYEQ